jgi:hypothetical protein
MGLLLVQLGSNDVIINTRQAHVTFVMDLVEFISS